MVVVPNVGRPWILRPVKLRSDLTLVFEAGVEVQALRGEFHPLNASLFAASGVKGLTITGNGATLRMWKADYQQPPYAKSEWRHALSFHDCEDVTISDLILRESGGDGIYLGTGGKGGCRRFTIRRVRCVGHHRQGISVISATDLLIESCSFNDTSGTAPMAGIDFEPNNSTERLVNCTLRHCAFENNEAYGVLFALGRLDASSEPISIKLEDCVTRGSKTALMFAMRNPAGVSGRVNFTRCTFADSKESGVVLRTKTLPGPRLTFTECQFLHLASPPQEDAPISILSRSEQGDPIGGVRFEHCVVEDSKDRRPIYYDDIGGLRLDDVSGSFVVRHGGKASAIELTPKLLAEWFPWSSELRVFERRKLDVTKLVPAFTEAGHAGLVLGGWQRGEAHFALATVKDKSVSFTVVSKIIGKQGRAAPIGVKLIAPSGKVTSLAAAQAGEDTLYAVPISESGAHQVLCSAHQNAVNLKAVSVPASAVAPSGAFHLIYKTAPLSFLVPKGSKEFAIRVAGDGGREQLRAIIRDALGKVRIDQDNVSRSQQLTISRENAGKAEIWSLELAQPKDAVIEDVHVMFDGVPAVLAATPEQLLVDGATPLSDLKP